MLRFSRLSVPRNELTRKLIPVNISDVKDTSRLSNFTSRLGISTARQDLMNNGNVAGTTYAEFSIYRGKASLPTFVKIESLPCLVRHLSRHSALTNSTLQRFGFSSSASPETTDKETTQSVDNSNESTRSNDDSTAPQQTQDPDTESDLSVEDLVKLVAEKEELLKLKHKEIEKMQDKVLRSYAEMENVLDRTKREAENSKKFGIQNFAKSLLDVADNLGRASSVVKESFSKIDSSKDSAGAVPLLKTLLEGVEMTEKQLAEVFRKFGMEKFDPTDEHFDPHRHHAVFQIPDASKPAGTVAAVLKPGYMLHDRVLRPAEVGVTEAPADTVST